MEIVLAKEAKMKLPMGKWGQHKPMLTKLGFAGKSKCKWMVESSPRFNLKGGVPPLEYTMREIEKLSGKLRVYLIGYSKKRIGLQIGDSGNKILERMKELLKITGWETKFSARVDYRGEQITTEGFQDNVASFVRGTAFHRRIMNKSAVRDQAVSVFRGRSFAKAVAQGKVDPNGFKLTLSIML